jgi:glycosyltransferase involved in cell wall biosynthesis
MNKPPEMPDSEPVVQKWSTVSHQVNSAEGEVAQCATSTKKKAQRRLLVISSHVVQYSSPVYRQLVSDSRIDLLVAYCSLQGAEPGMDPGFGVQVSWDTPLFGGYPWISVPNLSPRPGLGRFFGLLNPGLWRLVRDGNFNAILITGYFYASAWIAIAAAKWHGIPVLFITDSHNLRSWEAQSSWKLQIKRTLVRRIFSLGKILLALSSGGVEYLKSLGFSADRIVLTPYVVDNVWWTGQAAKIDRETVRAGWRIPSNATVALFCAKLQPWKGPMDLVEAFARANVANAYLVFAGDGPLRSTLERKVAELGIEDRVRFLGFMNQSQLPSVYVSADVLVLPSLYEPFGLVVNEAMLCGCPVVVSDKVGAKFDLVRSDENGYVFPAGNVGALAEILREILSNSERQARMGAAARQRMQTWSPREYVDGLVRGVELAIRNR